MSTKVLSIASFEPQAGEKYLFDTNVLIKIFYPPISSSNNTSYIKMYEKLIAVKSTLLISSIHISEFINTCIRFQFNLYRGSHDDIKTFKSDYRNTDDYKECMEAILEIVNNDILSVFQKTNDNFQSMDSSNLFLYGFSYDFNDALISELSRLENCILVTDDSDYINFSNNLTIVTNNKSLLMFSSRK